MVTGKLERTLDFLRFSEAALCHLPVFQKNVLKDPIIHLISEANIIERPYSDFRRHDLPSLSSYKSVELSKKT